MASNPQELEETGPIPPLSPSEYAQEWHRRVHAPKPAVKQFSPGAGPNSSLPPHKEAETFVEKKERAAKTNGAGESGARAANPFRKRRAHLPAPIKLAIVQKFACFEPISSIREWLKLEHGLVLDERNLLRYDGSRHDARIGIRLRKAFDATREHYITEVANHSVAHQAHRLKLIDEVVRKATNSKDYNAALKGLELAAKEMGQLTQTVKHEGLIAHVHSNADEAKAELAMRLQAFIDAQPMALPAPTTPMLELEPTQREDTHPALVLPTEPTP